MNLLHPKQFLTLIYSCEIGDMQKIGSIFNPEIKIKGQGYLKRDEAYTYALYLAGYLGFTHFACHLLDEHSVDYNKYKIGYKTVFNSLLLYPNQIGRFDNFSLFLMDERFTFEEYKHFRKDCFDRVVRMGSVELCKLLLQKDKMFFGVNNNIEDLIIRACMYGPSDLVKSLLSLKLIKINDLTAELIALAPELYSRDLFEKMSPLDKPMSRSTILEVYSRARSKYKINMVCTLLLKTDIDISTCSLPDVQFMRTFGNDVECSYSVMLKGIEEELQQGVDILEELLSQLILDTEAFLRIVNFKTSCEVEIQVLKELHRFVSACEVGDLALATEILNSTQSIVNSKWFFDNTEETKNTLELLLEDAVWTAKPEIVQFLLSSTPVSPNFKDCWAIKEAAKNGDIDVFMALLQDPRTKLQFREDNSIYNYIFTSENVGKIESNKHTLVKICLADKRLDTAENHIDVFHMAYHRGLTEIMDMLFKKPDVDFSFIKQFGFIVPRNPNFSILTSLCLLLSQCPSFVYKGVLPTFSNLNLFIDNHKLNDCINVLNKLFDCYSWLGIAIENRNQIQAMSVQNKIDNLQEISDFTKELKAFRVLMNQQIVDLSKAIAARLVILRDVIFYTNRVKRQYQDNEIPSCFTKYTKWFSKVIPRDLIKGKTFPSEVVNLIMISMLNKFNISPESKGSICKELNCVEPSSKVVPEIINKYYTPSRVMIKPVVEITKSVYSNCVLEGEYCQHKY